MVALGGAYGSSQTTQPRIDPADPQDFRRLLREVSEGGAPPLRGVVHLWSLDTAASTTLATLEQSQILGPCSVLHLVQALAKNEWPGAPRLWLISRGVQHVGTETDPAQVAQAPLWGLGRVVALEHPDLWGGLVDLEPV